jgi:hypothetical protein
VRFRFRVRDLKREAAGSIRKRERMRVGFIKRREGFGLGLDGLRWARFGPGLRKEKKRREIEMERKEIDRK